MLTGLISAKNHRYSQVLDQEQVLTGILNFMEVNQMSNILWKLFTLVKILHDHVHLMSYGQEKDGFQLQI